MLIHPTHPLLLSVLVAYAAKEVIRTGWHPCRVKYLSLEDWKYYNQSSLEIPFCWPDNVCVWWHHYLNIQDFNTYRERTMARFKPAWSAKFRK